MQPDHEHRKRVKHYHEPGDVHELTFSCYQRQPLLTNDRWRSMLSASLDRALAGHDFRLAAFVFMPEHVHLLVYPAAEKADVSALLSAIKRPFAFQVKKLLIDTCSPLLPKRTIRERPGKTAFRFWQEGPGYDRNLSSPKAVLSSMDYIHANPVSRSLVNRAIDWRWSSARHYLLDTPKVDPDLPTIHGLPAEYLQS
jgi:putative transposase